MRMRFLLLALVVAFGSLAVLFVTLPAMATGRSVAEQDHGGEQVPGMTDGTGYLAIYINADGQVQVQPLDNCEKCIPDPKTPVGPIFPQPITVTGPYYVPPRIGGSIYFTSSSSMTQSSQFVFDKIPGTNVSTALTPMAAVFEGVKDIRCVTESPADAAAADYILWEGPLDCDALMGTVRPFSGTLDISTDAALQELVRTISLEAGAALTPSDTFGGANGIIQIGADTITFCRDCEPDPEPKPECLFPCCPWPWARFCNVVYEQVYTPNEGIDDAVLNYIHQVQQNMPPEE